jgi:type IV secretory pathway ATPase VirB11/archaellum biosynthesis ATPase/nucleotide-binding universal stress UspA family protein
MVYGQSAVRQEGEKKILVIDMRGAPYGADIAVYEQAMRDVIDKLREVDVDEVVLSEYYERIYDAEQTRLLKEIADLITRFEVDAVWSPSHLGITTDSRILAQRNDAVLNVLSTTHGDPFRAYLMLLGEIKSTVASLPSLGADRAEDAKIYLATLQFMRDGFEKTQLVQRMKAYLSQLGEIPSGRTAYHSFFEVAIKPSFIGSRIFFTPAENLELVDQYEVLGSQVRIYKHPDRVEMLYFINPPEYALPPEKYFLLEKTKEVVAAHRPEHVEFMNISQARKYFQKIYVATIADLALQNNIALSVEEKDELATIVSRYTIGYGILELFLSDRKLTDVYIDSPLGEKPVYVVHSKYGQCQSNVIFTEDEAKSIVSRFRALSGRPFDQAHPILDFDLPDLQTRICVIGRPLAVDGTALVFRLHKDTPWTLAQFVDNKMFDSFTAGLLSFFVDAQASMLIVGSRGSGKTSMLQSMMLEIPQNLRIIVQEDTQELPVPTMKKLGFNIQRLKTRPPLGGISETEVSAEDALRTALRLGDSVLIVGEVRSTEAKALYEAMRVGAVGNVVMGTIHGESAFSIWDRVVNDLGVPTTSFKATDFAVVSAPIRFKGSLKRFRRLLEITEVKKHWETDPGKEGGFLEWMDFDANKDALDFYENEIKKASEWTEKVKRTRGISYEDVWREVKARGETKQYLVDVRRKLDLPLLLEAEHSVRAHNKYCLMAERMREEIGAVEHQKLLAEWRAWVDKELVKDVMAAAKSKQG